MIWEYLKQWRDDPDGMAQNVAGAVFVDQAPSDFKWPGYDYGVFTGADLSAAVMTTLTDPDAGPYMDGLIPSSALHTLPNSAHALFYEQAPQFNQMVLSFADGLSAIPAAVA